jgi:PAS domain S-box-containing protein
MTIQLYSVLPLVMAGVCLSSAAFEFVAQARVKGSASDFAFAIICIAAAAYNLACAGEYNVTTPDASVVWLRIQSITLEMTVVSFFWYVAGKTRLVPRWALVAALGAFLLFVSFQLFAPGDLAWNESRPLIRHVPVPFLGRSITYVEVDSGPLTDLQYSTGVLFFVYLVLVIVRYYRAGNKREATSLLLLSGIVFLATMNDLAIAENVYSFIYTVEYGWLAVVVFVGLQRSRELMEAAEARRALVESERRYRSIFESLQDIYFRADAQGVIQLISPSVRAFGYDPMVLIGRPIAAFSLDARAQEGIGAALDRNGAVSDFELSVKGGGSETIRVSLNAHRLLDEKGNSLGIEGIIRDITDRKRAEESILASLQEKSILLKEIHHRVKNNLQIISSLLYLHELRAHDPADRRIIQDCRNQVLSMALIHEDLYGSKDFRSVDFGAYLDKLVNRLLVAFRMSGSVAFIPSLQAISLGIDKAIPCGLVANELCTNALKYAFPEEARAGARELRVELSRPAGDMVSLVVADNGVGLPEGFEPSRSETLGMQIVERLVKQLGGTISLARDAGTRWAILFPVS